MSTPLSELSTPSTLQRLEAMPVGGVISLFVVAMVAMGLILLIVYYFFSDQSNISDHDQEKPILACEDNYTNTGNIEVLREEPGGYSDVELPIIVCGSAITSSTSSVSYREEVEVKCSFHHESFEDNKAPSIVGLDEVLTQEFEIQHNNINTTSTNSIVDGILKELLVVVENQNTSLNLDTTSTSKLYDAASSMQDEQINTSSSLTPPHHISLGLIGTFTVNSLRKEDLEAINSDKNYYDMDSISKISNEVDNSSLLNENTPEKGMICYEKSMLYYAARPLEYDQFKTSCSLTPLHQQSLGFIGAETVDSRRKEDLEIISSDKNVQDSIDIIEDKGIEAALETIDCVSQNYTEKVISPMLNEDTREKSILFDAVRSLQDDAFNTSCSSAMVHQRSLGLIGSETDTRRKEDLEIISSDDDLQDNVDIIEYYGIEADIETIDSVSNNNEIEISPLPDANCREKRMVISNDLLNTSQSKERTLPSFENELESNKSNLSESISNIYVSTDCSDYNGIERINNDHNTLKDQPSSEICLGQEIRVKVYFAEEEGGAFESMLLDPQGDNRRLITKEKEVSSMVSPTNLLGAPLPDLSNLTPCSTNTSFTTALSSPTSLSSPTCSINQIEPNPNLSIQHAPFSFLPDDYSPVYRLQFSNRK